MKRILALFSISLVAAISLCAQQRQYHLKVDEFSELKVVDGINIDYVCDPSRSGTVEFIADRDMASSIMFEPKKGKLSIMLASRTEPYSGLPTVRVYSSYLAKVTNEGDSLVRILSVADGAKFSCKVMGNGAIDITRVNATDISATVIAGHGTINIAGQATSLSLSVTGAGKINALNLEAPDVNCKMTGTGTIECHPLKTLTVAGLGGTLRYQGNPEIKKKLISKLTLQHL